MAVGAAVVAILPPFPAIHPAALAWGLVLGLGFVSIPQVVGIARRECLHQFEIRNLYPLRSILWREILLCGATFPAIATCEEVVFRGVLPLPPLAVAAAQFLVYVAGSPRRPVSLAISCAFLAALYEVTGSLGVVIGAHTALHTLTGRLRSPGLFGGVYPLLEQVKWRNLAPAWQEGIAEVAIGVLLIRLAA